MPSSLSSILRTMRAASLVRQAETIRDHPTSVERTAEAERYIREAMLQHTLGTITSQEKFRIFSILHFAMPEGASIDEDRPIDPQETPAPDPGADPSFDAACFLGCSACDDGGRMVDD